MKWYIIVIDWPLPIVIHTLWTPLPWNLCFLKQCPEAATVGPTRLAEDSGRWGMQDWKLMGVISKSFSNHVGEVMYVPKACPQNWMVSELVSSGLVCWHQFPQPLSLQERRHCCWLLTSAGVSWQPGLVGCRQRNYSIYEAYHAWLQGDSLVASAKSS